MSSYSYISLSNIKELELVLTSSRYHYLPFHLCCLRYSAPKPLVDCSIYLCSPLHWTFCPSFIRLLKHCNLCSLWSKLNQPPKIFNLRLHFYNIVDAPRTMLPPCTHACKEKKETCTISCVTLLSPHWNVSHLALLAYSAFTCGRCRCTLLSYSHLVLHDSVQACF